MDVDVAGVVRRARISYGGVAAMPGRARQAEAALEGRKLADAAGEVARILRAEYQPIDDARGSARYRKAMVRHLVRRALAAVWEELSL